MDDMSAIRQSDNFFGRGQRTGAEYRLNQLKQYMDFYKNNIGSPQGKDFTGNPMYNENTLANNWALSQIDKGGFRGDSQQQMPDFYGDQGGYQPAQYTAPQTQNEQNPMGGDVTNYLRRLLQGNGGGGVSYGMQQRNATQGVRG